MKSFFYFFFVLLFGCSPTNPIYENNFAVDSLRVDDLLIKIEESNINSIKKEKESFLNSEYSTDSIYLKSLNVFIDKDINSFNNELLKEKLTEVLKNVEEQNINKIHVLFMLYSGEMFYENIVIIVEEKGAYSPVMFGFNNSGKTEVKFITNDKLIFLKEFAENLNYSYLNKSFFNNPPQHFFVNTIDFENDKVQSFFKVKMLYSEKEILDKFFILKK